MGEKVDNQSQAVIGVDIGGTNIKIVRLKDKGLSPEPCGLSSPQRAQRKNDLRT